MFPLHNTRSAWLGGASLLLLVCAGAAAQQAGGSGLQGTVNDVPQTAKLTVSARLVVLDVVVTDKAGHPVTGLGREDFAVFEDGKPQRIRSFESPADHALPPELASSADPGAVFDAATPVNFGRSPVTLLVLDQLNTHFADSSFARRSLREYLQQQPSLLPQPTTLLDVSDNRFKQVHGYTRDRDALLKALAAEPTHMAWTLDLLGSSENGPIQRLDQSLRALEQITQSSARIPGRKNVVWVGGGFPTLDPATIDGSEAREVKDTIQHVTNAMQDAHVTLYAVDPASQAAGMAEITDEATAEFVAVVADASAGATATFNANEGFDNLAPITGGRVVRGMNDVAGQIAALVESGRSFYTLGYTPTSTAETAARYRRIRIECRRQGLTLRTRDGYYTEAHRKELAASRSVISYDLSAAAESTVALNGLRVQVSPSGSVSAPPGSFLIRVSAEGLAWKPEEDGTSTASVAVLAVYLDRKGKQLTHTLHGMTAHARAGVDLRDPAKTADFAFTVEAKAGKAKTLRFVVRDTGTGRMGSVDLPAAGGHP